MTDPKPPLCVDHAQLYVDKVSKGHTIPTSMKTIGSTPTERCAVKREKGVCGLPAFRWEIVNFEGPVQ